jgi:hypothetical protein
MDREPIADLTALDNLDSRDLVSGYFADLMETVTSHQ